MARGKAKKGNPIIRYIRETRSELQKVRWPTRQETIRLTQIVLAVTAGMGVFLWLMDVLFSWWLGGVLVGDPLRIGGSVVVAILVGVVVVVLSRRRG